MICIRPDIFPRHTRMVLLSVSILLTGGYLGYFLSMKIFSVCAVHGMAWKVYPGLVFMATVSFVVPFFLGKSLYCYFICPFGALQELIGRLSPWKKAVPATYAKWLKRSKFVLLAAILLLIFFQISIDIGLFEPFEVFRFADSRGWTKCLAAIFLVASFFTMRPWCHYFCPTGAFLEFLRKKKSKRKCCS